MALLERLADLERRPANDLCLFLVVDRDDDGPMRAPAVDLDSDVAVVFVDGRDVEGGGKVLDLLSQTHKASSDILRSSFHWAMSPSLDMA